MMPPMNDQDRYDDLIARVAARAEERCAPLPPPVSRQGLAAAEETLGFALHPLLARLYREIADGGFGPEYRFLPLDGPAAGAAADGPLTSLYAVQRAERPDDPGWSWPQGVVPLLSWGCGMLACVDCASPAGTVLLFEPNPVDGDWADAWFVDSDSLAEWLETSLAGRGWYTDPDADDDWGDPDAAAADGELQSVDLRRWAGVRDRLGSGRPVPAGA
jgi:SMI1 / KNR4 family (SUKH-1)